MTAPSILLVHPDRKTQRTIQRILGTSKYAIDIVDNVEQGIALLATASPLLVIVDANAVATPRCADLMLAARARGADACMTLLGAPDRDAVPRILGMGSVSNLLVHPMPVLAEELTITVQKLIRNDLFGAEKYLLWGTDLDETIITRASQRAEIVTALGESIKARGQSVRVAQQAMLVADELISNAVHNAPRDAAGVHYRRDLARDQELELDAAHTVRFRWGCDARYLAVEVSDPFGSLDRDTILDGLAQEQARESGEGAGLGIALVYRSCDHLVFNLSPGKRTEIIALIDVRSNLHGAGANPAVPTPSPLPASSYNVFVERA